MAANLNTVFKEIDAKFDLLAEKLAKMQSQIDAIQQRLDQQEVYREPQIGQSKPRRGRPPTNRRN